MTVIFLVIFFKWQSKVKNALLGEGSNKLIIFDIKFHTYYFYHFISFYYVVIQLLMRLHL